MKLYELEWGLYPRRISIYLAEKGITGIERIAFDALEAWPAPEMKRLSPLGTVPILETDDGARIRASIAILEYLEEHFPSPEMLGPTPVARGRTREFVNVIDEAAIQFVVCCRNASPLFAGHVRQSREAALAAADAYQGRLRLLDAMVAETNGPFLTGQHITIADCVAMATVQFAENFYGVALPDGCSNLAGWHSRFAARPSAALPSYPAPLLALAYGLPSHCPAISA